MSQRTRAIFLLLTIVAVLFVSAFGTTNVYADDGTPPPPPAETGEVDPPPTSEAEPVATEPAVEPEATEPAVEPVATETVTEPLEETAPSEDTPVVEEAPVVEEGQPAEEEAAPILEQVPDNTVVTVLNAEGEAQPLTSQESAEAIATSDPVWCPAGQVPGGAGCTPSFSSFQDLLAFMADPVNAITGAGTIYVQMGVYAGPETAIDFNAYDLSNISGSDLTVQGGWDPADNSTDDTTTLNVPITIGTSTNPWVGSLTFNNIWISNVSNQTGLTLVSENNVTLSNVQVTNSQGGADITAGGFVEITNSKFDNNADDRDGKVEGFGLKVDGQGGVFLGNVSASLNEEFGADIKSAGGITVWNSVFSGNIAYSTKCKAKDRCHCVDVTVVNGGGYGLKAVSTGEGSAGEIYLQRVTAEDNYLFGAHLEGTIVTVEGEEVDGVMVGNIFSGNGLDKKNPQGYGLEVLSTEGVVTLRNVEANNNQLFGANIQAKDKVIVTNSFFNGNKAYYKSCSQQWDKKRCHQVCVTEYVGYGLNVVTDGGIQLVNVEANDNNLFGAHLEGALTIVDYGVFSNNGSDPFVLDNLTGRGLEIVSTSEVILSQIYANNNQAFGADIYAAGNVELATGFFNGHKVYTYSGDCTDEDKKRCHYEPCVKTLVGGGYGLRIETTGGSVALANVEANDNYLFGMEVISAQEVALDQGNFNDNKEGIKINAQGAVRLSGVTASNNKVAGATITSAFGIVRVENSVFSGNYSLAYGKCTGKTYYGYGLKVVTTNEISLTNVTADNNALYGAYLEGNGIFIGGGANSFSNNGTGTLSDHTGKGLEIVSTGGSTVSLTNVTASGNQEFGAKIKADGTVLVSYSVFSGNHSYASSCTSKSSSYSDGNSGKKCGGKECTKTYYGYGLEVVTTGDISVSNVEANENYLFGAHLDGANVTVSNSTFSFNVSPTEKGKTPTGRGLEVVSTGDATLSGVDASNNQLFGATVEAGGEVTVLSSTFMNNKYSTATSCKGTKSAGYGLKVVATEPAIESPITLENVTASGNGAEGVILQGEEAAIAVTNSTFNNNGADGLNITASGTVTLTNVTADGNKGDGVDVKGVCTNTVNVKGGNFTNNDKYGLKVVDATYAPDATTPPTFSGNDSGNVFQSDCVSSGGGNGSGNSGGGNNTGGNQGLNWWYWWWYWLGYGHR